MYGCSEEDACQHNIQEIVVDDVSVTSSEKESAQDLRAVSHIKATSSVCRDMLPVSRTVSQLKLTKKSELNFYSSVKNSYHMI